MTRATVDLTGTSVLTRFIVRRDRVRIVVWIGSIAALVAVTTASIKGLYPTQADLDLAAVASKGNAAAIAFNGPAQGLDTVGGQVAFQAGATGLVVVALMSMLMIGRLTRGEEEAGRLELVRSLPVGGAAPTVAASMVVFVMDLAVGALVAGTLLAEGLSVAGSIAFGVSFTLLGLVFACVALVAAQISENTRVVYGIAGAVLGASYVLRAVGDIGDGTVSWLSPIGWVQKTRPFAGERWWPFLPTIGAAASLLVVAEVLAARRDLGGGLVAPRPGPRTASAALGSPLGLAVRLQRGSVIGWGAGVLLTAVAYGSIANSIDDFVRNNKTLAEMFAGGGASLTEWYLATSMRILALVGAGFVIQSTLRIRGEETQLHAEPVLATPVSRRRWAMSHLFVAAGGSVVLLAIAGLAVGISYGLVGGGIHVVPGLVGDALVYIPAMWLMVGLTFALIGLVPRGVVAAWAFVAFCFIIGLLGGVLGLPRWLMDLSPFDQVPQLPAAHFAVLPLIVITVIAGGLGMAGLAGLRRRDIG